MTEWWTYRPSDFLLFSPRTYHRLFELYNESLWPVQPLVTLLWLALLFALWRGLAWAPRVASVALAASWAWIAWAFHAERYADINWAASGFAVAFAAQALLLLGLALAGVSREPASRPGLSLLAWAICAHPWLGMAFGRPWREAEWFALAPDATAVGTLGLLVMLRPAWRCAAWPAWIVVLGWCAISGATLWTMGLPWALAMPAAALGAAWAARHGAKLKIELRAGAQTGPGLPPT
jgi:hypothetical protein